MSQNKEAKPMKTISLTIKNCRKQHVAEIDATGTGISFDIHLDDKKLRLKFQTHATALNFADFIRDITWKSFKDNKERITKQILELGCIHNPPFTTYCNDCVLEWNLIHDEAMFGDN